MGYRGNIQVPEGQAKNVIELRDNKGGSTKKLLPFFIRCDAAGMEAYADGSPKKWWSKLALLENGREVVTKTIIVNDPLTYKGIRIYQASMGQSSTPKTLTFAAAPAAGGEPVMVEVPINGKAALPDGESLSVLRWVPDYYVQDNEVFRKSDDPENPAVQLGLTNAKGETKKLWILYAQANTTQGQDAPYDFLHQERHVGAVHRPGSQPPAGPVWSLDGRGGDGLWPGAWPSTRSTLAVWAAIIDVRRAESSCGWVEPPTRTATASRRSSKRSRQSWRRSWARRLPRPKPKI